MPVDQKTSLLRREGQMAKNIEGKNSSQMAGWLDRQKRRWLEGQRTIQTNIKNGLSIKIDKANSQLKTESQVFAGFRGVFQENFRGTHPFQGFSGGFSGAFSNPGFFQGFRGFQGSVATLHLQIKDTMAHSNRCYGARIRLSSRLGSK